MHFVAKKSLSIMAGPMLLSAGLFTAALRAESPEDDAGRIAIEDHCKLCHALETVTNERKTPEEWKAIVAKMIKNGAQLTDADQATIIAYLSRTYGTQIAQKPDDPHTAHP